MLIPIDLNMIQLNDSKIIPKTFNSLKVIYTYCLSTIKRLSPKNQAVKTNIFEVIYCTTYNLILLKRLSI